jgi:hypothetical protein
MSVDGRGIQMLFIAWQHAESRRVYPVARLRLLASGQYELVYVRAVTEACEHGFAGLPGFENLERRYVSRELPAIFTKRPARGRSVARDRAMELGQGTLDAAPISLFVPLPDGAVMRLEAFAPPLPLSVANRAPKRHWGVFAARGVGRIPGTSQAIETLAAPEPLTLAAQRDNPHNPNALLLLLADGTPIGYVPDYFANEMAAAGQGPTTLQVEVLHRERLNFPPAEPVYQVLCRYTCDAAVGRALFHSAAYAPVTVKVIALCR